MRTIIDKTKEGIFIKTFDKLGELVHTEEVGHEELRLFAGHADSYTSDEWRLIPKHGNFSKIPPEPTDEEIINSFSYKALKEICDEILTTGTLTDSQEDVARSRSMARSMRSILTCGKEKDLAPDEEPISFKKSHLLGYIQCRGRHSKPIEDLLTDKVCELASKLVYNHPVCGIVSGRSRPGYKHDKWRDVLPNWLLDGYRYDCPYRELEDDCRKAKSKE